MSDVTKSASRILGTYCQTCVKSVGCCIRDDLMQPNLEDVGLPSECHGDHCDEFVAVDNDSLELF